MEMLAKQDYKQYYLWTRYLLEGIIASGQCIHGIFSIKHL